MKSIFSICRIFSFSFFLVYLLSSCKNTRVITITQNPTFKDKLIIVDKDGLPADTVLVNKGDKIKWKIGDGVRSFEGFPLKPNNEIEILEKRPSKELFSKTWKAKVKNDPNQKPGDGENYSIIWTDENGVKHTYDPRIQLNP